MSTLWTRQLEEKGCTQNDLRKRTGIRVIIGDGEILKEENEEFTIATGLAENQRQVGLRECGLWL